MKSIKVGLIGAGQIAYGHARELNAHPAGEVVAVADPNTKRAKAIAKQFGISEIYGEAKDLLADADVDAVSIGVPNKFHAPIALDALKAGKHVMLDKPFALNLKEAKEVVATAKKKRKVFALGMNQRFNPDSQIVRALVDRGDLGEVYHAKAYWLRRSGSPKFGTWFCRKELAGGGCMLDIGVHVLDLALYLMDNFDVAAVSGATYSKLCPRGIGEGSWGMSDRGKHVFDVDDFATGLIKLRDGATVALDASWALHQADGDRHDVQLYGSEGGATAFPARLFRFGRKKGEYEVVEPQGVKVPYPNTNRFANWLSAILGEEKLICTPQQALAVQQILDGIYESCKTGKEVRVRKK